MRRLPILALCLALIPLTAMPHAWAQSAAPLSDEAAVRALITHELEGWDKHDAKQVASCHTENVTWQNPFGVRIHSRAMLEKFLTNLFQRPGYLSAKDTSAPKITDVHILSPNTAVVWSEEKSEGQIDDATKKPMAPRYSHYLEVLVKQNGAWLISDSMIMDEYPRS
jgi:uncharacterized protein (TIGR02246 family)